MKTFFTNRILVGLLVLIFLAGHKVNAQTYPYAVIQEGTLKWTLNESGTRIFPTPLSTYYPMAGFTSTQYKEYAYNIRPGQWQQDYVNFRLLFPNGYDSAAVDDDKYPMLIMLHGHGECGWQWQGHFNYQSPFDALKIDNNDNQLKHGGKPHLDAVNRPPTHHKHWPGFVLFPQNRYNGYDFFDQKVVDIIEQLVVNLKIDPNRIYVHGLSAGGRGTFKFISERPDLFAAGIPMCPVGTDGNFSKMAPVPLWITYGGMDPQVAVDGIVSTIQQLRNAGGNPKSSFYPDANHGGTWAATFNEDSLYTWLLKQNKLNINIDYRDKTEYCPGEEISTRLSISQGFLAYEWRHNDNVITGANTHTITATALGEYRVRFKNKFSPEWTAWSPPVHIAIKDPTPTPTIVASGSTTLPALDGSTSVTLSVQDDYAAYAWSTGAATKSITISNAGNYAISVTEEDGCPSLMSEPVVVTKDAPINIETPTALVAITASESSINLFWQDNSNDETGYEVYRSLTANGGYTFVTKTKADEVHYADKGLTPNTTYYYQVRAVSNSGSSAYIGPESATTLVDNEAPTRPGNLVASVDLDLTSVALNWEPSSDNVGITAYHIYEVDENNTHIHRGSTTNTSYIVTGLTEDAHYTYVVKAIDITGNLSEPSNQVSVRTALCGLRYTLYKGTKDWISVNNMLPEHIVGQGTANNFDIGVRTQYPGFSGNVNDDYFGFEFEGYLYIEDAGNYDFVLNSDDGSVLWIDEEVVVSIDVARGESDSPVGVKYLTQGSHKIKVRYFEDAGGNSLNVKYRKTGSGTSLVNIPDEMLCGSSDDLEGPAAPSDLTAIAQSESVISLTWTDNSSDEYGFELYRSTDFNGPYSLIYTSGQNVTAYHDTGLAPNTTYYYNLRAIGPTGESKFTSEASSLDYAYYEGSFGPNLPNFSNLTPIKTGKTNNFDITLRDRDSNYGFVFEGSITIFEAGNHIFYTNSDDGSKLYINDIEVVNNDGSHGDKEEHGSLELTQGTHNIRVTYYQGTGGQSLSVYYDGPNIGKQLIPDVALNPGIVSATTLELTDTEVPSTPENLQILTQSATTVGLSWDASTDNFGVAGYYIFHHFDNPNIQDTVLAVLDQFGNITANNGGVGDFSINTNTSFNLLTKTTSASTKMGLLNETAEVNKISYLLTGLKENTAYNITVSAFDLAGNESDQSEPVSKSPISLPITLVNFSGKVNKESVILNWITASEKNNDYFTIERAFNNKIFEEIGRVNGSGTTISEQKYTFIDDNPIRGTLFYRIKQTDYNGDFEYSDIIAIQYSGLTFEEMSSEKVILYPNPTSSHNINLKLEDSDYKTTAPFLIRIVDLLGKTHIKYNTDTDKLKYGVQLPLRQKLTPGIYIIMIEQANEVNKLKLIIDE